MKRITFLLVFSVMALSVVSAAVADPYYIYGMHDTGGESNMADKGAKGWIVVTEAIGCNPSDYSHGDYSSYATAGYGVIVRINNGYDSSGTLPNESQYDNFAQRCANYVQGTPGVLYWIIGNEPNLPCEWPGNVGGDPTTGEAITVARYTSCYNKCYTKIKSVASTAKICPAASGTWAPPFDGSEPEWPNRGVPGFLDYWVQCLNSIGATKIDGLPIHVYTHGCDKALIINPDKMGHPYESIYYHFRVYLNYMGAVPTAFNTKPVFITESDQNIECKDANGRCWYNSNNDWCEEAYKEINSWNLSHTQKIRCLVLFRWQEAWQGPEGARITFGIVNRSGVIADWRDAMNFKYVWNTSTDVGTIAGTVKNSGGVGIVGATVSTDIGGYTTTSGTGGAYTLSSVAVGTYNVTASKSGYVEQTQTGKTVTKNQTTTVNFTLQTSNDVVLNGSFENGFTSGVGNSWTSFVTSGYGATWSDGTDYYYDGAHSQKIGMPQPTAADKYAGVYQKVSTVSGSQYTLTAWERAQCTESYAGENLVCKLGYDLTGGTNFASANVNWAEFNAVKSTWVSLTRTLTATGGNVTIFLEGWRKWAAGGGGTVWFDKVTCTGAAPQTGTLSGTVKNSSAVGISGATVSTSPGGYYTTTNSSGVYSLSVAADTYDVTASKVGYNSSTQTGKVVVAGQTTTVNFTLTTGTGIAENFETMPSWTSSFNAAWGSAATWSIVAGGQSGNFLQAARSSQGSSAKAKVYTVPVNTSITISVYMKCPSYTANEYWMESAFKLGSFTAQDFDENAGTWTMIKKFSKTGTNGNSNTWTKYSATVYTGTNTQVSMGYKLGSSSGAGPTVGWDTFKIE